VRFAGFVGHESGSHSDVPLVQAERIRTAFERVKTGNVRIWRAAIFFWEKGVALSAHRFSELFNFSYDATRNIYLKLGLLANRMLSDGESYAIPSSLFAEVICKRSIETPAKSHPRSEELPFSEPKQERCDHEEAELQFPLDENQQVVFEQFQNGTPLHFETLSETTGLGPGALSAALMMLELNELIRPLVGARYQRVYPEPKVELPDDETKPILEAAVTFIKEHFHGVSRKYLQIYVAIRWCMTDRTRWRPGALLRACTQSRMPASPEIKQFITDRLVFLPA
jgi:hypothetical protein